MRKGKTRASAPRGAKPLEQILVGLVKQADGGRRAYSRKETSPTASRGGSSSQCQDREPSAAPSFEGLARRRPRLPALAAIYVGELLSDKDQEAYEIHFMACAECVAEVELWRAITADRCRVDEAQYVTAADVLADLDKRMGDERVRAAPPESMRTAG